MLFDAFAVALEMVRHLRQPLAASAQRDLAIAQQRQFAAASVPSTSERAFADTAATAHLWRVAAAAPTSFVACLRVAEARCHVDAVSITPAWSLCDRIFAMFRRLAH